jgi:hypothetical protein
VSPSKIDLTEALLLACRPALRWLTPKVLNAFAFRQKHFQEKGRPLYCVRTIRQANGKSRTLQIPGRSLKLIQKSILTLLLNPAQDKMPSFVMGGRRSDPASNRRFGIFENAVSHLGQEFVASFDIANFFPSVPFESVLKALQEIRWLPPGSCDLQQLEFDAAVLVAKLCTFRGRLPQGAPTSPALANLVFSKLESNLRKQLHQDFVYTRYYDDITISLSSSAARRQNIRTARELQEHAEAILKNSLHGSAFQLNPRKTRSSSQDHGHLVTGLRVGQSTVSLPRNKRRVLTAILHQIQRDGFVQTACRHIDESYVRETSYFEKYGGHRHPHRHTNAEDFSVHALRQFCAGLQVELSPQSFKSDDAEVAYEGETLSGTSAISTVKELLTQSWAGHLRPQKVSGGVAFHALGDVVLATVLAEKNTDFFLLDRRAALKTTELWYYLRGWASGMLVKSPDHCFGPLHQIRQRVERVLADVNISVSGQDSTRTESGMSSSPVNISDLRNPESFSIAPSLNGVPQQAVKFTELFNEFYKHVGGSTHESKLKLLIKKLRLPANSRGVFVYWLQKLAEMIFDHVDKHPIPELKDDEIDPIELVRILPGRFGGRRSPGHRVERALLKRIHGISVKSDIAAIDDKDCILVQSECLKLLQQTFSRSLELREKRNHEVWLTNLRVNDWKKSFAKLITDEVELLANYLESAKWETTGEPVFKPDAQSHLLADRHKLSAECTRESNEGSWDHLYSVCVLLSIILLQNLHGSGETFSEPVKNQLKKRPAKRGEEPLAEAEVSTAIAKAKQESTKSGDVPRPEFLYMELHYEIGKEAENALDFVHRARNRFVHPMREREHYDDLNRICRDAAEWIGRVQPKVDINAKASDPGSGLPLTAVQASALHLPLTALEASELQLTVLRRINGGLRKLCHSTPEP